MFGLKPDVHYSFYMSEDKEIIKFKNFKISIQQHYGDNGYLKIYYWKRNEDDLFVLKKWITISLTLHSFYLLHIYPHLGKCHPNLRSKFYIGKPIEKTWKNKEEIK